MTKRLIVLVLVCILAIPIFAVPTSAVTVDGITYDSYGTYLEQVTFNVLEDVYNLLIAMDENIDGWFDTIWQEIRNSRVWQESTLFNALDTINSNLVAFNSNVDLWIEAQTEVIVDIWEASYDQFDAFVDEVFFGFWEDWSTTINDFKANTLEYLRQLVNGSIEREAEANEFAEQTATEATEFDENMEIIDEWTEPDYETGFDPSVDNITGGEDIGVYTAVLGALFDDPMITPILFMAFSFSLISFVVFGKV